MHFNSTTDITHFIDSPTAYHADGHFHSISVSHGFGPNRNDLARPNQPARQPVANAGRR